MAVAYRICGIGAAAILRVFGISRFAVADLSTQTMVDVGRAVTKPAHDAPELTDSSNIAANSQAVNRRVNRTVDRRVNVWKVSHTCWIASSSPPAVFS
jgi:hypothetical protein